MMPNRKFSKPPGVVPYCGYVLAILWLVVAQGCSWPGATLQERVFACLDKATPDGDFIPKTADRLTISGASTVPGQPLKVYQLDLGNIDVYDPVVVHDTVSEKMYFVPREFFICDTQTNGGMALPPNARALSEDAAHIAKIYLDQAAEFVQPGDLLRLLQAIYYDCPPGQVAARLPYFEGCLAGLDPPVRVKPPIDEPHVWYQGFRQWDVRLRDSL